MMAERLRLTVFGAAGQVGSALTRRARVGNADVAGFTSASADIRDLAAVRGAINASAPHVIVNAAAYTAVDKAEEEPALAQAINCDAAAQLAAEAKAAGVPLIHLSTDYVFDGRKTGAYVETDPVAPLSVYGRTKAHGEHAVLDAWPKSIVARTSWVFGIEGKNFVKTMLRLAQEREVVRVVNDQHGCPTFADDLADGLIAVAHSIRQPKDDLASGIYHMTGAGETSWYAFAQAIQRLAGERWKARLEPIPSSDYPTPAHRPANSVLNTGKLARTFGVALPAWADGLERMMSALKAGGRG